MEIDKKILSEISRYNSINNYIVEQEGELPPPPDEEPLPDGEVGGPMPAEDDLGVEPPMEPETGQTIDIKNDPDVDKINTDGDVVGGSENTTDGESEELEITDLVNSQKNIETKQDDYFDNLFKQLGDLESKLGSMDNIVNKLNSLEDKIEKYRPKTPEEKLELRSIDSGPYSQKLTDFFVDKQEDMEKSGKNEYILTTDDVENFTDDEIRQSFS
jgi:hypothetical protein|tara:strand:- start:12926 stop:13570 length:645 start_codon:yes stop_codon:yes gene_type:complete